jgi:tetraacyldisaccharide 4'-kinase
MAGLSLLSFPYAGFAWLHRELYRRGAWRAARLDCRVVSVGSPVAGGSGKTPFAGWLAARLRERGQRVVLASRGYGRTRTRGGREPVVVVSDGKQLRSPLREAGDEPALLVGLAPGVPVLVGPDRAVVGLRAQAVFGADVLVLDDGMQHHRLARDVEIVTLDGRSGLGNGRVLPRGPLREPAGALRHADCVVVVDPPLPAADEARLRRFAPAARRATARRVPRALRSLRDGTGAPPAWLAGREVGALCGIARPGSLRRTLEALGAHVVAERSFPDHHRYRPADLVGLAAAAPCWVTTEKDAGKILPAWLEPGADLRVLAISLAVDDEGALLDWLESRIR